LESLPREISFDAANSFSLFSNGELVAFGQLILKSEKRGYLGRIVVAPTARRKGHGETLARGILAKARSVGCERACLYVDSANSSAIKLYSKLGFSEAAAPRDEYSSTQSRYMEKLLVDG
jgi:ribosomal protein S18 acetylase RimI-like enzyme